MPRSDGAALERRTTIEMVQRWVTAHFKSLPEDLQVRSNRSAVVFPRQVAMYLARQITIASLAEIGRQFGGKHHSTVLHSINKIHEKRRSDQHVDTILSKLTEVLSART
jgi:chromosomal replication initiator protein